MSGCIVSLLYPMLPAQRDPGVVLVCSTSGIDLALFLALGSVLDNLLAGLFREL